MPANKKATSTSSKPAKSASAKASKKQAAKTPARKPTPPATAAATAKPGDQIVIDSSKVGSPPREGEVLEVVYGQVSVSYRVRWPDGHQSLIAPGGGITRIISSRRKG